MAAPAQDSRESSPAEDEVILATAGYDHCIKFWTAHTGKCMGTLQHPDSQVNAMEISPDGQLLAACGYQHIRMFDVHNTKPNPVVNFEGDLIFFYCKQDLQNLRRGCFIMKCKTLKRTLIHIFTLLGQTMYEG